MPIFEVEHEGSTYEVDAPDMQTAVGALTRGKATVPGETRFPNPQAPSAPQAPAQPAAPKRSIDALPAWAKPPGADYVYDWGKNVYDSITNPQVDPSASEGGPISGALDTATALVTGLAAPVVGTVKKYGSQLLGGDAGNESLRDNIEDFAYQLWTQPGQAAMGVIGSVAQPLTDALNKSGEGYAAIADLFGASPETQQDVHTMFSQVVPTVLSGPEAMRQGARGTAAVQRGIGAARETVRGQMEAAGRPVAPAGFEKNPRPYGAPAARARRLGFILDPAEVQMSAQLASPIGEIPNTSGKWRASYAGPEFREAAAGENTKLVTAGAKRELGIPEHQALDDMAFAQAKAPHNAVYNELERLVPETVLDETARNDILEIGQRERQNSLVDSDPGVDRLYERLANQPGSVSTADVLYAIRKYRARARTLFRSPGGANPVSTEEMAHAYRQAASVLEDALMRTADSTGNSVLVGRMREARTALAKIHNVEDATVGGFVDPQLLLKLQNKDAPLSGFLGEAAFAAEHFPGTMRSTVGSRNSTPNLSTLFSTPEFMKRRLGGEMLIRPLLREGFQSRFGGREPGFDPGASGPDFPPPPPPPPGRSPDGQYPWSPAGEGPLSLVPEGDGLPFSSTQIPPTEAGLFDELLTDFFRGADTTAGDTLTLRNPLDEAPAPSALPGYGHPEMPEAPYRTNPDELRLDLPLDQVLRPYPDDLATLPEGPYDIQPSAPAPQPPLRGPDRPRPWNEDRRGVPRAGGLDTQTGSLNFAPDDAHSLPGSILDLLPEETSAAPDSPYGVLPPQLQELANVLLGKEPSAGGAVVPYNVLQGLVDELGLNLDLPGPTPPMNPPRGSRALRGQRDALEESRPEAPPATPDEFSLADEVAPVAKAPEFDSQRVDLSSLPPATAIPKGEAVTMKLYRGGAEGADLTAPGHEGMHFYAPDEAGARVYGPNVVAHDVQFTNLLRVDRLADLTQQFNLPANAAMEDILGRARQLGYDGVEYTVPYGPKEIVKL